jgi:hypothetical protein
MLIVSKRTPVLECIHHVVKFQNIDHIFFGLSEAVLLVANDIVIFEGDCNSWGLFGFTKAIF